MGKGSGEGMSPSLGWGSGGITPGKFLKFETQFGAFWQEIDGSPVFHLCERKHCHNARQWYIDIVVLLHGGVHLFQGEKFPGELNPYGVAG